MLQFLITSLPSSYLDKFALIFFLELRVHIQTHSSGKSPFFLLSSNKSSISKTSNASFITFYFSFSLLHFFVWFRKPKEFLIYEGGLKNWGRIIPMNTELIVVEAIKGGDVRLLLNFQKITWSYHVKKAMDFDTTMSSQWETINELNISLAATCWMISISFSRHSLYGCKVIR